jgi:L-tartrate/succinate antiporter
MYAVRARRSTAEEGCVRKALAPVIVGIAIALMPAPEGLSTKAWQYCALFAAVIAGVITEPVPGAVMGLAGVAGAAVLGLVGDTPEESQRWALSGFANGTVWLIFAAYMFTLGYAETGLGRRIALHLIRVMGRRTLGLGYAVALADLTIAPFTPSATARTGGTIYPIIRHIPELYGSRPDDGTARRMGAYLLYTALAASMVTSSMFITALAPNALAISLISTTIDVTISWTQWFRGFAPIGLLLLAIVPVFVYTIYPPEIEEAPDAPRWAAGELSRMGPIARRELVMLGLVCGALTMWVGASSWVDPAIVAILVVVLMVMLDVVSWRQMIGHAQAWNVLVWFATLVTMAGGLAETGFVDWLGASIAPMFSGLSLYATIIGLILTFYFVHYFFASITAHTAALLPVFLGIAVAIPGMSPTGWALLLAYPLGLMGILTSYASGQAAVYYGSGYVGKRDFWVLGLVMGCLFIGVYAALIVPWLSVVGF